MELQDIKLIIFDLDGTITHLRIDWPAMKSELTRVFKADFSRISVGLDSLAPKERQDALRTMNKYETAFLSEMKPRREILNFIRSKRFNMALDSNNTWSSIQLALEGLAISHLFSYIVSADDVSRLKPDPEGLYQILQHTGIPPSEALFVGDRETDLAAGKSAGIASIDPETFIKMYARD